MFPRSIQLAIRGVAVLCVLQTVARAQERPLDLSRPACGKVCKLVCETKSLVAIGYGNECKQICVPGPSRSGCKHCAICCGECQCDPSSGCQTSAPKCEFCWRDWFACGCARPRSVKILTKYQAEKKICWFHWEVVDATCCECAGDEGGASSGIGIAEEHGSRLFFKPAPENAQIGDVLPVSDEDLVKLAAVLPPDPREAAGQVAAGAAPPKSDAEPASIAERLEKIFKK